MKISVVMPAYNEEKIIGYSISRIEKILHPFEIIVVSDGSLDDTANAVRKISSKIKHVKLIELPYNMGKGAAITAGFRIAEGHVIGFIDADDAFDLQSLKRMIGKLRYYDCVIASKWKGQKFSSVDEYSFKKFASRIWNLIVKIMFRLNFSDTQGGAKFFTRKVLNKIGTNFYCKGFEFDVELLWKIKKAGFRIHEEFVPSKVTRKSKFSFKQVIPMLVNIIKLKIRSCL